MLSVIEMMEGVETNIYFSEFVSFAEQSLAQVSIGRVKQPF